MRSKSNKIGGFPLTISGCGPLFGAVAVTLTACATDAFRPFPLREPIWRDTDLTSVSVKCHPSPTDKDPKHVACAPDPIYNPLTWDGVDNLLFRPLSETLGVVGNGGESVNVNSLDEVPDSSWFTNRVGVRPLSAEELELGRCTADQLLDGSTAKDGAWIIDKGKVSGDTYGFRVNVPGKGKYLFKADDADTPEHSSAAQTIGGRILHAVGYYVPCEQIVYFRPSVVKLLPGLKWRRNFQIEKDFGRPELESIFAQSPKRGGLVRMVASAWVPGYNVGGYEYQGTRADDPNDVIPHEDRRELRGKRILGAWLERVDERRGNTLDIWIADDPKNPESSPGHVIHTSLDTSEVFGATYGHGDRFDRRRGHSYMWDWGDLATDFVTFGARTNVWDHVEKTPGQDMFFYTNVKDFVPDRWKSEYSLKAYSRMTERDAAWMARVLAHFTPDMVKQLARMANFTNEANTAYLEEMLEGRLEKILERYLTRLSPLANLHVEGAGRLCGVDLAELRGVRPSNAFRFAADVLGQGAVPVDRQEGAVFCVTLPHFAPDGTLADDAPARYVRVRVEDGVAKGPLIAHLYDEGPVRGYRLVGLERPERGLSR